MKNEGLKEFLLRIVIGLNGLDAGLTFAVVKLGFAEERNPFLEPIIRYSPILFIVFKILFIDLLIAIIWKSKNSKIATWGTYLNVLIYLSVIVYHLMNLTNNICP